MAHFHTYHPQRDLEREEELRWQRQIRDHEREWIRSASPRTQALDALQRIHQGEIPRAEWESVLEDPEPSDPEQQPSWRARRTLAAQVLARDATGYADALRVCRCLADIVTHVGPNGMSLALQPLTVTVSLDAPSSQAMHLPNGALVSMQELTRGNDRRLYQDYVCGLALRAARDVMAVLLVEDVIVDVSLTYRAREEDEPFRTRVLSVLCPRAAMDMFDWSSCDASNTVEMLAHEMDFSEQGGFRKVPQITRE